MQRSKHPALMFLLGAVLVGGVLGLSADRVLARSDEHRAWAMRERMYDDLGLSPAQRVAMDSAIDVRHHQIDSIITPLKPQLDAVRAAAQQQFQRIMTPEQWAKFRARQQQDSASREQNRKSREQKTK